MIYKTVTRALSAAVVALLVLWPGVADASVKVGETAPAFVLKDQTGKTHRLSWYRGKVVVLEWTNPQCPFVKRHYDQNTMARLARAFPGKQVMWLAVNSSHFNKPADSRAWHEAEKIPYPTLQDPTGKVGRLYGAKTTPHMFVIGPRGKVRYAGAIDDDPSGDSERPKNYVEAALRAVLAGKTPDPAETRPYGCSVKYARR